MVLCWLPKFPDYPNIADYYISADSLTLDESGWLRKDPDYVLIYTRQRKSADYLILAASGLLSKDTNCSASKLARLR